MSDWKEEAIRLATETDMSWRQIGRELGVSKSSVSDLLRKQIKGYVKPEDFSTPKTENSVTSYKVEGVTHLIVGDTQCKPNESLDYMLCIGKFIADKQPDVIVHIGDGTDFPSLSSYDKGTKSFEGRRVKADIEAGRMGLDLLTKPMRELQKKQKEQGEEVYSPRMVYTLGNHEFRIDRLVEFTPELEGIFGTEMLPIAEFGFEVYPYLKPVCVDGISYVHFLANPFTGKPYGGTALNQLKNVGNSFVVGHKQTLDVAMRPTLDGRMQIGVINGACYPFDEAYKGWQGNSHFRGVTVLHEVKDGFGLPMFLSLDYIMEKYG